MRTAEQVIESIVSASQIPRGKRRQEILRELRAHVEDFVIAARQSGCEESEIEKLALAHFGDPAQIATGFAWVYRQERRSRRALAFAVSTLLLAISIFAAILVTQTGLALLLGTPILKVLAGRHAAIQALDILASVAAYLGLTSLEPLFPTHPFAKAAASLALIDAVLLASGHAAGLPVAFLLLGLGIGIFCRAVQLFVPRAIARVGIVVVSFPLAGVALALLRSPLSATSLAATSASWLALGMLYQLLMTRLASRFDQALRL